MRLLVLMRHAEAVPEAAGGDHARPLSRRGRLAATLMGAYLAEVLETRPLDAVLMSDSRRTRETYGRMRACLPAAPEGEADPDLYLGPARGVMDRLRSQPEAAASVLLVGHNPTMEEVVARLAPEAARPLRPASMVVLATDAAWSELGPDTVRAVAVEEPRTLL
ncbi:MAG: histidine phosphatase family protein [Paracoccaceae bacterium]